MGSLLRSPTTQDVEARRNLPLLIASAAMVSLPTPVNTTIGIRYYTQVSSMAIVTVGVMGEGESLVDIINFVSIGKTPSA